MKNDANKPLLKKPTKVKWVDWKRAGKQAAGAFAMAVIATSMIFTMGLSLGTAMIVGAIGFGGAFAFAAYIINTMINGNKPVTHHTEGKATIAMGTIGWVAAGVLGAGIVLLAGLSSAFILLPVIIAALGAVITGFCTDKHYKAVEKRNTDLQEKLDAGSSNGNGDTSTNLSTPATRLPSGYCNGDEPTKEEAERNEVGGFALLDPASSERRESEAGSLPSSSTPRSTIIGNGRVNGVGVVNGQRYYFQDGQATERLVPLEKDGEEQRGLGQGGDTGVPSVRDPLL